AANISPSNSTRQQTACTLKEEIARIKERGICAVCFCSKGDLLSQWRAYSGGGYGYSIGFNPENLKALGEISKFDQAPFELAECFYDTVAQKCIVEDICAYYLSFAISRDGNDHLITGWG